MACRPNGWTEVRLATEDTLLALADHLPAEAAEALLNLATGGTPRIPAPVAAGLDPFEHPDAQRRFRVVADVEELARALDYPWDKWAVFLHPAQREAVERDYGGPARVAGIGGHWEDYRRSAPGGRSGSRQPGRPSAADHLLRGAGECAQVKLQRLIGNAPRVAERMEVHALDVIARRLYELKIGRPEIASPEVVRATACKKQPKADRVRGFGPLPAVGMGRGRRRLAADSLGGVPRCRAPGPEDPSARGAAAGPLDDLRASACCTGCAGSADLVRPVQQARDAARGGQAAAVRLRRGGRGAGPQRRAAARSWRRSVRSAPTRSSSPATWASGSFSSRSPGRRWASTSAGAPERCASTTGPRTRSARRPTGCSGPRSRDVDGNSEDAPRHDLGLQRPASRSWRARHERGGDRDGRPLAGGRERRRRAARTRSASSSAPRPSCRERARRSTGQG